MESLAPWSGAPLLSTCPLLSLYFPGQWQGGGGRFDGEVAGEGGSGEVLALGGGWGDSASPGAACWSEVTQLVAR